MKRTMQIIIILGYILLLHGTVVGCGKSEKKYVGAYIYEEESVIPFTGLPKKDIYTLEIKENGIYSYTSKTIYTTPTPDWMRQPSVTTGSWRLEKVDEKKIISFSPPLPGLPPTFSLTIEDNKLVDSFTGKALVKRG